MRLPAGLPTRRADAHRPSPRHLCFGRTYRFGPSCRRTTHGQPSLAHTSQSRSRTRHACAALRGSALSPAIARMLDTQVGVGWGMGTARRVMGGGGRGESDSMANHVAGAGLLFTSPKGHRWSKRRIRGNQHRMGYTEQPTHCDRRLLSNAARGCRLSRRTGTV